MPSANRSFSARSRHSPEHGAQRGWPIVLIIVALLTLLGWTYLMAMVADMIPSMDMATAGPGMAFFNEFNIFKGLPAEARAALAALCLPAGSTFGMPSPELIGIDLGKIFLMWVMMALAMMLPSAVPMLRAYYVRFQGREGSHQANMASVMMVLAGYLTVWFGYAVVATLAQWVLSRVGAITDMMAPASMAFSISVLFVAGLYQFTPAKSACLQRCWFPRWVFSNDRPTLSSELKEGLVQGWICLGCCWAVMTVMFVAGLMNVIWIALLGAIMAIEKTFPLPYLPKLIGIALLSWSGLLATVLLTSN